MKKVSAAAFLLVGFYCSFSQSILDKTKNEILNEYKPCKIVANRDTLILDCGGNTSLFLFKNNLCFQAQSEMAGPLFNDLRMKIIDDTTYKQVSPGDVYSNGAVTYTFLPASLSGQHNGLFTIIITKNR